GEAAFWDALRQGRSGAGPVEGLDTSKLTRKIACQVREPIDVGRPMGRASQLAVVASREAAKDAGVVPAALRERRTAIIIGTTMGETDFIEERLSAPESEWLSPDHMKSIVSGRPGCIARNVQADLMSSSRVPESAGDETGVRGSAQAKACGPAIDLYGACAAGNMAIAKARRHLLEGRCDMALAGGSDGFSRLAFIGFMRLRAMAAEVCRPFDEKRDGLLVGEGAVIFVMERESSAKARGASIRARVKGASITCEDYHPTRPHPEGDGLTRAIQEALRDAGMSPSDIDYVCAHGTGTPHNDAIEVKVMENCFPEGVSFSSIKALTGHTMGAAAAMEAACCVLSLQHQELIPTWHLDNVLQPCALDAIQGAVRPTRVRCVVNNSAGFGGYNSSVILTVA
ncbi:MAG: beta-ketoacyl-[acyl-carrier-protein] synthase family protein, partial [Phycisphaerales bacterium]